MPLEPFRRKLPLWHRLRETLRAEILSNPLPTNMRLPTEPELAERHGVSLITVRQALKALETEGLISRYRRRGTFINRDAVHGREPQLIRSIDNVFGSEADIETEILDKRLVPVPAPLQLQFPGQAELTRVERLRRTGRGPIGYMINHLLPEYGERLKPADLKRWPVTRLLRDKCGVEIGEIVDTIGAEAATPEIADRLAIEPYSPVLTFDGLSHDAAGRLIDVVRYYLRADRSRFRISFDVDGDTILATQRLS